jgi:hypothetical protein
MAKTQQKAAPVVPNFRDIDKEAAQRAQAALAGGKQPALKVPKGTKSSVDKNGTERWRWQEQVVILSADRSVAKSGLLQVNVNLKVRQSKENSGGRVYAKFYLNLAVPTPENHIGMNDRSNGAIMSLLTVTGFMPAGGELRGSLLDKMFPSQGQPGSTSPLNNKVVLANIVQTMEVQKDAKTKKPLLDSDGEVIREARDSAESFLPLPGASVAEVEEDEDEDEDEDDEDVNADENDEDDEEEEPAPAPVAKSRRK